MESTSKINEVPEKLLEFNWKIPDFFSLSLEKGKKYISPPFSYVNESWCLVIHPNGLRACNSEGYIGVYLKRISTGPPTSLEYSLGVKAVDNIDKKIEEKNRTHTFVNDIPFGIHKLLSRSELTKRKSQITSDNSLIVYCDIKDSRTTQDERASTSFQGNKILEDFREMFLKRENCDVVISVKGKEFPAHKNILAARSPVLASTFRYNMKEKETGTVAIEDCDPSAFPDFLCFLYCGDASIISAKNVFGLFTAADKYNVLDLRDKCMSFMKENLSLDNFCEIITIALLHTETELIHLATNFFVANAENIVKTVKWQSFIAENPIQGNELVIKCMDSSRWIKP